MRSSPEFSVIIPTRHRLEHLARCLDRLAPAAQDMDFDAYEIIVTDDGVEVTAAEMMAGKYPWASWAMGSQRGPAANRNHGARQAKGKWLVFLDDDCLPDRQLLSSYADIARADFFLQVLEGRIYANRPKRSLAEVAPLNEAGNCLYSCNFAILKTTFETIGGFDERFPYAAMEDLDFKFRLREHGIVATFVRDAAVCHPWRYAAGWQYLERSNQSVLLYVSLHPAERAFINARFYFKNSVYWLAQAMKCLLRRDWLGLNWCTLNALSAVRLAFLLHRHANLPVSPLH